MENEIIKSLSKKNNVYFVDNANLISKNEEYFVDSIHFSHKGMRVLASNFAKKIKSIYES
jgi:lysophospholipase L1-like esterase